MYPLFILPLLPTYLPRACNCAPALPPRTPFKLWALPAAAAPLLTAPPPASRPPKRFLPSSRADSFRAPAFSRPSRRFAFQSPAPRPPQLSRLAFDARPSSPRRRRGRALLRMAGGRRAARPPRRLRRSALFVGWDLLFENIHLPTLPSLLFIPLLLRAAYPSLKTR